MVMNMTDLPNEYTDIQTENEQQVNFDSLGCKPYLAENTELQGRYTIGKVVVKTSESVQYIGYDNVVKSPVIIREFLPLKLCTRAVESDEVIVFEDSKEDYNTYLKEFLDYFRTIARLREIPAIISIYDIFNENNTAYTVEDYEELIPFNEYLRRSGGILDWSVARPLFMPLASALSMLNKNGVRHLGVCPDNLMVSSTGKIKLRGFAMQSSRRSNCKFGADLHAGCSAPEQYGTDIEFDERTDIYGFIATLFYSLTGKYPEPGNVRRPDSKLLISSSLAKRIPPHVITALARGLQVTKERRIPDFESLRAQLSATPTVKNIQEEITRSIEIKSLSEETEKQKESSGGISGFALGMISCVVVLLVLTVVGIFWLSSNPLDGLFDVASNLTSEASLLDSSSDLIDDTEHEYIKIPNLINVKFEDAVKTAEKEGSYKILRANKDEFSDDVPEGSIMEQNLKEGSTQVKGVAILVTVSKGSKKRTLPDIKNQDLVSVSRKLGDEGLIVLSYEEYSNKIDKGKVIGYQTYKKGDKVDYGSRVVILVSKGPKPTTSSAGSSFETSSVGAN